MALTIVQYHVQQYIRGTDEIAEGHHHGACQGSHHYPL